MTRTAHNSTRLLLAAALVLAATAMMAQTDSQKAFERLKNMPGTWEGNTEMGPIISPAHLERFLSYIEAGKAEGALLRCGCELLGGELAAGYFVGRARSSLRPG